MRLNYFNSIKVRLEQYSVLLCSLYFVDFNSIKVRLEQLANQNATSRILFQFHKGAIRTGRTEAINRRRRISIP